MVVEVEEEGEGREWGGEAAACGVRGRVGCVWSGLVSLFLLECLMLSDVLRVRVWVFVALDLCWAAAYLPFYLDGKVRS